MALAPQIGRVASELLSWSHGARIAQDDVLWKPPGASGVGYHRDSAYISDQFKPRDNNSVTIWIALDDADESTGTVEYAVGSHLWPRQVNETATNSSFHGAEGDVSMPAWLAAQAAGIAHDAVKLRAAVVPRGGAIFHHQDILHGSRPNPHLHRQYAPPELNSRYLPRTDSDLTTRLRFAREQPPRVGGAFAAC